MQMHFTREVCRKLILRVLLGGLGGLPACQRKAIIIQSAVSPKEFTLNSAPATYNDCLKSKNSDPPVQNLSIVNTSSSKIYAPGRAHFFHIPTLHEMPHHARNAQPNSLLQSRPPTVTKAGTNFWGRTSKLMFLAVIFAGIVTAFVYGNVAVIVGVSILVVVLFVLGYLFSRALARGFKN